MVAEEVREYMAQLGFRKMQDMVGRVDLLRPMTHTDISKADSNYNILSNLMHIDKRQTIDLSDLLTPAWVSLYLTWSLLLFLTTEQQLREGVATSCTISRVNHDEDIATSLDLRIMREASSIFPTDSHDLTTVLSSTTLGDSTKPVKLEMRVNNVDRAVGTLLSYNIANR